MVANIIGKKHYMIFSLHFDRYEPGKETGVRKFYACNYVKENVVYILCNEIYTAFFIIKWLIITLSN